MIKRATSVSMALAILLLAPARVTSAASTSAGVASPAAISAPSAAAIDRAAARAVFERLKGLAGPWQARSTRGWEETGDYKVVAGGSVVMYTSFDAHPNETMITMYTMDQDRLLLTHYCVAGNQPRLVATRVSESGDEVEFTFLDGGNLTSRDQGHMDRVVLRFLDPDRTSSRWTWYQNGEERWLEEIEARRVTPASAAPTQPAAAREPQAGSPAPP